MSGSDIGDGLEVCFEGSGEIILLDAATAPRSLVSLSAYASRGLTCAWINRPGTVVLMSQQSASALAGSDERSLRLLVTTEYTLNFRASPGGTVTSLVGSQLTLRLPNAAGIGSRWIISGTLAGSARGM